jgi:hypothetical protein
MQRTSFGKMACPVARSLERVGEWWSILIIRDALHGFTRFDEFQKSLNIAPNMPARRRFALGVPARVDGSGSGCGAHDSSDLKLPLS